MRVQVSDGELVDKHSVLRLKSEKIKDPNKLSAVLEEKDSLEVPVQQLLITFQHQYELLYSVNKQIWELTDIIKSMSPEDSQYASVAHKIFLLNDKRFRIKKVFNMGSQLKEQKSYEETSVVVRVNMDTLDITRLDNIFMSYDNVHFLTTDMELVPVLQQMFPTSTISSSLPESYSKLIDMSSDDRSNDLQHH